MPDSFDFFWLFIHPWDKVDGELVVMVRYVDYGNTGEGLSMQDLAPWSPFLGRIPPQVGTCYAVFLYLKY